MSDELTLAKVSDANGRRCERWHGPNWRGPADAWTLADWSNAMAGEAGEAANVVKKLRRAQMDLWGAQKYPGEDRFGLAQKPPKEAEDVLMAMLADELVSEAQGFPERL